MHIKSCSAIKTGPKALWGSIAVCVLGAAIGAICSGYGSGWFATAVFAYMACLALGVVIFAPRLGLAGIIGVMPLTLALPQKAQQIAYWGICLFFILAWMAAILAGKLPMHKGRRYIIWSIAFLLVAYASTLFSLDRRESLFETIRYTIVLAVFQVFIDTAADRKLFHRALLAFGLSGTALIAYGTIRYGLPSLRGALNGDLSAMAGNWGELGNPNSIGGVAVFSILAMLTIAPEQKPWLKRGLIPATAVCILGLLTAFSRSAWLAAGVSIAYMACRSPGRRRPVLVFGLVIAEVACAAILLGHNPTALFWVKHGFSHRDFLWRQAVAFIKARPLLGIGPGAWQSALRLHSPWLDSFFFKISGQSHNIFLTKTAELGIPGFILLVSFWFTLFWRRYPRLPFDIGIFALMLGLFTRAFFESGVFLGRGQGIEVLYSLLVFAGVLTIPRAGRAGKPRGLRTILGAGRVIA